MRLFHVSVLVVSLAAARHMVGSATAGEPEARTENVAAIPGEIHVSPGGSADHPGTADRPLRQPEEARDLIRRARRAGAPLPAGGVTVWFHSGDYFRDRSFELNAEDSGGPDCPIVYRAAPGGTARWLGGARIPASALRPAADAPVVTRLDPTARGKVLQADLKSLGVGALAPLGDRLKSFAGQPELFFAGRPMPLARWPNEGWTTIDRVIDRGSISGDGENPRGGTFTYREDRPARWNVAAGVWLHGYWCHDWADECLRVASIDTQRREIHLAAPHGYGIGPSSSWNREPRRYCAVNLLEELDAPGEWYLDRSSAVLYFWPPETIGDAEILLSTLDKPLVVLDGCEYVTLRGLRFEASRAEGIVVRGGRSNRVARCTLANLGGTAVDLRGGKNHAVAGCEMFNLARSGVTIEGGDRRTLEPAAHEAINNHIHHFGRLQRTYAAAIHLGGVGHRAAHNLIHDAPHSAVLYGGNEHVIELNQIHHVAQETSDVGALYTGRDWTSRGNLLRWNYIHDLGQMGAIGTMGIYLDDCDSGDRLVGNVFYKAGRAAFIGGGRDNTVENNLMIECDAAVHLDARGLSRIRLDAPPNDSWNLLAKAQRLDYRNPPWSTRYPELASIMDREPLLPLGNVVRRNVAFRCQRWLSAHGMDKYLDRVAFADNLVTDDDPGFVDAARRDWRLRADSPVLKLPGWEPIPLDRIGPRPDED